MENICTLLHGQPPVVTSYFFVTGLSTEYNGQHSTIYVYKVKTNSMLQNGMRNGQNDQLAI